MKNNQTQPEYFTTQEVADFIGVSKQTVEKWRKKGIFMPDVIEHGKNGRSGVYYYDKEKVLQLKSVYHKQNENANRKGKRRVNENSKNLSDKFATTSATEFNQQLTNLPEEILTAPRFIAVNADKTPKFKAWSNPDNQKLCTDITGIVGFDTCGHNRGEDYLLIDFDHILSADGNFKNDIARAWYQWIKVQFGGDCYCERSISGDGLHFLALPTAGKFNRITNKDGAGILHLDNTDPDIKIELFYKSAARYCLVTGNFFETESRNIPKGAVVDGVLETLLSQIKNQSINDTKEKTTNPYKDYSPDIKALIDRIINGITPKELESKNYLQRSDHGAPYPTGFICPWCNSGTHVHKTGALTFYETPEPHFVCHACSCGGDIINYLSRIYGIDNHGKDFFSLLKTIADDFCIDYDPKIFVTRRDESNLSTEDKLNRVESAIKSFERDREKAIETIKNATNFDSQTVTAADMIQAAAFTKIFAPDIFARYAADIKAYGNLHHDRSVNLRDFNAAIKKWTSDITRAQTTMLTERNALTARINSDKFISKNDCLSNFKIPNGYSITPDNGITFIDGKEIINVCRRPVVITAKRYSVEDKIFKLQLAYMTHSHKWQNLPLVDAATAFSKFKIVELSNHGLSVTTSNASKIVDYLDAFNALNDSKFPMTYTVARCGWYRFNDTDFFIDPRRVNNFIDDTGRNISVEVDSRSQFVCALHKSGTLEEWQKAYQLAKKSPVARLMVAAVVAPPLLNILGERNFLLYVFAHTRAGKTTALNLAASVIGSEKIIRSFDATKNGLAGAAAEVNDYPLLIDEKQVADNRIKDQITAIVYAIANGIGRLKLSKDSKLKDVPSWHTVAIMNGETPLLPDNATAGANTRLLPIAAPKVILDPATCKTIRDIISTNYGHVLPLVIDKIFDIGFSSLRDLYSNTTATLDDKFPETLPEHRRYIAVLIIADMILNSALNSDDDTTIDADTIFDLLPTASELDDTEREKDFVLDFIAANQNSFIGGNRNLEFIPNIYGKLNDDDGFSYLAVQALKDACTSKGFDYQKVVADLIACGFFVPDDKIFKGRKKPLLTVSIWLGRTKTRCYRIPNVILKSE